MVNRSPRVHVSLPPEVHKSIVRIAQGTGMSFSGFVSALLTEQADQLAELAATIERAQQLSVPLSGKLQLRLGQAEKAVQRASEDASDALDQLRLDLTDEAIRQEEGPRTSATPDRHGPSVSARAGGRS